MRKEKEMLKEGFLMELSSNEKDKKPGIFNTYKVARRREGPDNKTLKTKQL